MRSREQIREAIRHAQRTGGTILVHDPAELRIVEQEVARLGLGCAARAVQRERDDCFRASMAWAYDLPYDELPALHSFDIDYQATWERWATQRGMRLLASNELIPLRGRWIASVPSLARGADHSVGHVVVMEGGALVHDTNTANPYTSVDLREVRQAYWLVGPSDGASGPRG